jgi:serine/threonine protein kinase
LYRNILLSLELNAKIADFGDAVIVGESDLLNEVASSFKYTSPEMRELIKNYSFNTDIW